MGVAKDSVQPGETRASSFRSHMGETIACLTGGLSEASDAQLPASNTSSALQGNSGRGEAGPTDHSPPSLRCLHISQHRETKGGALEGDTSVNWLASSTANSAPADSADTSQPGKEAVSCTAGQEQCQASI